MEISAVHPDELAESVPSLPFAYILAKSHHSASTCADAVQGCLQDLESKLRAVDCRVGDVVNVRTYLPSEQMTIDGYAEYNEVYNRFFRAHDVFEKPARATIGVRTPTGVEVQMEAFALTSVTRNSRT